MDEFIEQFKVNPNTARSRKRRARLKGEEGAQLGAAIREGRAAIADAEQRIFDAIGFKPMSPHERHLRQGMGRAQRQAMRDKGWSRYW